MIGGNNLSHKEFNDINATKKLLYYHNENKQAICSLKDMLKNLDGKKGVNYDGMPGSSGTGDPTGNIAIKRARLEIKLKNTERIVSIVDKALDMLPDVEREIVEKKYIQGYTWTQITISCSYSRGGALKAGQRGLDKVRQALFGVKL